MSSTPNLKLSYLCLQPKSDTRTFVFNGEEIILSAKHGSAVLDDVHKFLVAHYPLGAKEDNNDPAASKVIRNAVSIISSKGGVENSGNHVTMFSKIITCAC